MVVAGEKHLDKFCWGEAEQFHTVEHNGNRFGLFEVVTITTTGGRVITGKIGYISETWVDILPERLPVQRIKFSRIKSIRC